MFLHRPDKRCISVARWRLCEVLLRVQLNQVKSIALLQVGQLDSLIVPVPLAVFSKIAFQIDLEIAWKAERRSRCAEQIAMIQ